MSRHVNLARLEDGRHVQIGRARSYSEAHHYHARLQWRGMWDQGQQHFIDGQAVSFYRVREVGAPDIIVSGKFPLDAIRTTREGSINIMRSTKTTPGGIVRPRKGDFATFPAARERAKTANHVGANALGRGHRAIKAQDGNFAVVFRPAVTANKQRKVRSV